MCPYCQKVRDFLDENGIEYEKINVPNSRDDPIRQDLLDKSGVGTVPVMKVGEDYIGDSSAIIAYLQENLEDLK